MKTTTPNYFVAVSIDLGCPGIPGMPAGNIEGLMALHRYIGHRLAEAGQLLMPVGASGELNNCVIGCHVRDIEASVAILKETIGPVLIEFARIAWFDFREDFYRPIFPGPEDIRCGALIDKARMLSFDNHAARILAPKKSRDCDA